MPLTSFERNCSFNNYLIRILDFCAREWLVHVVVGLRRFHHSLFTLAISPSAGECNSGDEEGIAADGFGVRTPRRWYRCVVRNRSCSRARGAALNKPSFIVSAGKLE